MGISMATKGPVDPIRLRRQTREWLATHTIQDVRILATDLENAGEDVDDLLEALDELEAVVNEEPSHTRRPRAKAPA